MNLKIFLFRLAAVVTAFVLGVGFFNAAQYLQSFFQATETATVQPEQETVFVPARVEPSPLIEPTPYIVYGTFPASNESTEAEFNADGVYSIIEDLPKGFRDFDTLSITTKDYEGASAENNYQAVAVPPEGYIFTKKLFRFARINIADKQIAFETETRKGISYKFVGEFIDGEKIEYKNAAGVEFTEYAVLKGRLTKLQDGKKVAEIEAHFATGGC
jgi:hypothetical protein